jgi:hypothetical protein
MNALAAGVKDDVAGPNARAGGKTATLESRGMRSSDRIPWAT